METTPPTLSEAIEAVMAVAADPDSSQESYQTANNHLQAIGSRAADVIVPMLLDSSLSEEM